MARCAIPLRPSPVGFVLLLTGNRRRTREQENERRQFFGKFVPRKERETPAKGPGRLWRLMALHGRQYKCFVYTNPGPFDVSRGEVVTDTRIPANAQNETEKHRTSGVERKKEARR